MKIQAFLLLLSMLATESFSQENASTKNSTRVYHYGKNIQLVNYDGTSSTIYVSGNSATLFNSDGSQSSIDRFGNSSNLTAIDGTITTISHNGRSSILYNSDGSPVVVSHGQSTSSCFTDDGKHTITHTFGRAKELCHKIKIDALIHMNWLVRMKEAALAEVEVNEEELQN